MNDRTMVGASVSMATLSLYEHTGGQLDRLCEAIGFDSNDPRPRKLLRQLLGPGGARSLADPPLSPSNVADDTTPIEFSIAFDTTGECAIRVLGESIGTPTPRDFIDAVADEYDLDTTRLDTLGDLFLPPGERQGPFTLWHSLIFRAGRDPKIKLYLNPQISGPDRAASLVSEGFRRLRIPGAFAPVNEHALRRPEQDSFAFFALDLDRGPLSRVKVYVAHEAAECSDVERAAELVPGIDPLQIREFCAFLGGGKGPFRDRPLISSYSFVEGDRDHPSNYSLYFPIRSYVPDDGVARARVHAILAQYDFDGAKLDEAIAAISGRTLRDGVGLISHVSLRLGQFGSGITVYLSSEAYRVMPARRRPVLGIPH
ncbi:tryptophan dimethylallyltransferase family protein [Amycolatopsis sp. lyj-23]|uniref:tryptophan dimethylallyltransferase family protein n=1 Tax=Amycolatopsis sp. lyj-23 TaxID=2789283 RepID=UPI00397914B8